MPIYEYECPKHGVYEHSQRITEDSLKTCVKPECNEPVRKLISQSSFALKGTGWYLTDYARSGSAGTETAAASDSSSSSGDVGSSGACGGGGCASA